MSHVGSRRIGDRRSGPTFSRKSQVAIALLRNSCSDHGHLRTNLIAKKCQDSCPTPSPDGIFLFRPCIIAPYNKCFIIGM